jgi:alpha-glucosidase
MATQRTPVTFGNARFTVFGPDTVRMEYQPSGTFPKETPVLLAEKLPKGISAEVKKKGKSLTIETEGLTIHFTDDGKPFSDENLSVEHDGLKGGRGTWKPTKGADPLCEHTRSMDVWPHLETRMDREDHPGLFDRSGARAIRMPKVYRDRKNDWVRIPEDVSGQMKDTVLFGHGPRLREALQSFVQLFGPVPLVPRWVFGFWYSRWYEYSQKDIVDIAKRYRRLGLPMDVMVIDTEWRQQGWWGYDWHSERFDKPKEMMRQLKKMGLRVPLNDHPGYNNYDPLPPGDKAIPQIKRVLDEPPVDGRWACDWARKACVKAWKEKALNKPFKDGMDFWWIDGWTRSPFGGVTGQFWLNKHYYELAEEETGDRGLVLSRWGGWGSHRYPVQFSGDTQSDWATLKRQIDYTAAAGDAGACYWSHDIGGFFTPKIADDLYVRWVQFGAFSPVLRTHSAFGTREPYEYSKRTQKAFKEVVAWRYAMVPYWYHLAREAHETGLPLCRPMYLSWPEYKTSFTNREQYTVGRDVLVAPIYRDGVRAGRPLWVPPGTWVRPQTDEILRGQEARRTVATLDEIPVYFRLGSIIPHQEPAETTHARPLDPLHLDVYPDPDEAASLDLYEDDGTSRAFEEGAYARTPIRCTQVDKEIRIAAAPAKGSFKGQLKKRTLAFNVWIAPDEIIDEVRVDGEPLKKSEYKRQRTFAAGTCKSKRPFLRVDVTLGDKPVELVIAFA